MRGKDKRRVWHLKNGKERTKRETVIMKFRRKAKKVGDDGVKCGRVGE